MPDAARRSPSLTCSSSTARCARAPGGGSGSAWPTWSSRSGRARSPARCSSSAGTPASCSTAPARSWPRSLRLLDPSALDAFDRFEGYDPTRPDAGEYRRLARRRRARSTTRPAPVAPTALGLRAAGGADRPAPGRRRRLAGAHRRTHEWPPLGCSDDLRSLASRPMGRHRRSAALVERRLVAAPRLGRSRRAGRRPLGGGRGRARGALAARGAVALLLGVAGLVHRPGSPRRRRPPRPAVVPGPSRVDRGELGWLRRRRSRARRLGLVPVERHRQPEHPRLPAGTPATPYRLRIERTEAARRPSGLAGERHRRGHRDSRRSSATSGPPAPDSPAWSCGRRCSRRATRPAPRSTGATCASRRSPARTTPSRT